MECNRHCEIPPPTPHSPPLVPFPHQPAAALLLFWPPNLDRYLLLSSSYRLRRGCVGHPSLPPGRKDTNSPPHPHPLALPLNIPLSFALLDIFSKAVQTYLRKGAHPSHPGHSDTLSLELPVVSLQQNHSHQRPVAQGQMLKNCTKSSTFIHSLVRSTSAFGQYLYISSVAFRTIR